jgi:hypothetical protein
MMTKKRPRDLNDIKTPAEFWDELSGGQFRWLALILLVANVGLLIWMWFDREEQEMYFPFRARGKAVWIISFTTLLIWIILAILNWRARARTRELSQKN